MSFTQRIREIRSGFASAFWVANFTEIFERVAYYGMSAVLAIYLTEQLHLSTQVAGTVMGIGVGLYPDYGPAQRLYAKLGYRPDGRGIAYNERTVAPGETVRLDDDLVLWMTKPL